MMLSVCISSMQEAQIVLAHCHLAQGDSETPLALITPAFSASVHGIGYWQSIEQQLKQEFPHNHWSLWLDCGDAAGLAMQAMAAGVQNLIIDTRLASAPALMDLAKHHGAQMVPRPTHLNHFQDFSSLYDKQQLAKTWKIATDSLKFSSDNKEFSHAY
ncbi:MAG: hypothetical protein K2Q12_03215 [Rickettsiales bacterium]|nr:hypothetical protein [Rickettsiales bacterium]